MIEEKRGKHNFGRFTLSAAGTPIDSLWSEWNETFGSVFPEDIITQAGQLQYLNDLLDNLSVTENPYGYNREEAISSQVELIRDVVGSVSSMEK